MLKSDGSFHLVRTEASGTGVHMARSTVDNRLNTLDIGLPSTVGTSVGVGNLNAESYALTTKITLSHSLHLLSPIISKFRFFTSALIGYQSLPKNASVFFAIFAFFLFFLFFLVIRTFFKFLFQFFKGFFLKARYIPPRLL